MKKLFNLFLTLLLFTSCFNFSATAVEANMDQIQDITSIIEEYKGSDGAYSEEYIYQLEMLFINYPDNFMISLEKQPEETINKIIFNISSYASYGSLDEIQEFEAALFGLEKSPLSEKFIKTYTIHNGRKSLFIENDDFLDDIPMYDVNTIKSLIEEYQKNDFPMDEEFYNLMSEIYLIDSNIFAKTIEDLSTNELTEIAQGIQLVCEKTDTDLENPQKSEIDISESEEEALEQFEEILSDDALLEDNDLTVSVAAAYPTPSIGNLSYSYTQNACIEVGYTTYLSVPLTETTTKYQNRQYVVNVYCKRNNESEWLKGSASITIPANQSTTTARIPIVFSNAGSFNTRVEVLAFNTILARKAGSSATAWGYWRINVDLKSDRSKVGRYGFYDASGSLLFSGSALGQSASNASMATYEGNTPTGNFYGLLGEHYGSNVSYGPYKVVKLSGNNNYYVPKYRDGIWIHGGRSQTVLSPTNGCVRVFEADQKTIQDHIIYLTKSPNGHFNDGKVIIQEFA